MNKKNLISALIISMISVSSIFAAEAKTESKAVDAPVVDVKTDNTTQPTNTAPTKKPADAQ